jgi:hypothetical protein
MLTDARQDAPGEAGRLETSGRPVHDIISDIIDWDQANKAYMAGEGQTGSDTTSG